MCEDPGKEPTNVGRGGVQVCPDPPAEGGNETGAVEVVTRSPPPVGMCRARQRCIDNEHCAKFMFFMYSVAQNLPDL